MLGNYNEQDFRKWYANKSRTYGLHPNPDNPQHRYDYRKAYQMGLEPTYQPEHKQYRWPDVGKSSDYNEQIDHATGLPKNKGGFNMPYNPIEEDINKKTIWNLGNSYVPGIINPPVQPSQNKWPALPGAIDNANNATQQRIQDAAQKAAQMNPYGPVVAPGYQAPTPITIPQSNTVAPIITPGVPEQDINAVPTMTPQMAEAAAQIAQTEGHTFINPDMGTMYGSNQSAVLPDFGPGESQHGTYSAENRAALAGINQLNRQNLVDIAASEAGRARTANLADLEREMGSKRMAEVQARVDLDKILASPGVYETTNLWAKKGEPRVTNPMLDVVKAGRYNIPSAVPATAAYQSALEHAGLATEKQQELPSLQALRESQIAHFVSETEKSRKQSAVLPSTAQEAHALKLEEIKAGHIPPDKAVNILTAHPHMLDSFNKLYTKVNPNTLESEVDVAARDADPGFKQYMKDYSTIMSKYTGQVAKGDVTPQLSAPGNRILLSKSTGKHREVDANGNIIKEW